MRAAIRSLICAAVVLSALGVQGAAARADDDDRYTPPRYNYDPEFGWGPGWGRDIVPGTSTAADYDWVSKQKEEQKYYDYLDSLNPTQQRWADNSQPPQQNNKLARVARSKPAQGPTLRQQATAMIQQKQYNQAIRLCDQALALNPNDALAYNERGAAYSWMDQNEQAIDSYTKAIQLDPSLAVAWRNRGSVYFHQGAYAKAVADCNEAIRLDGSYASAYATRTQASAKLSEAKSATVAAASSAQSPDSNRSSTLKAVEQCLAPQLASSGAASILLGMVSVLGLHLYQQSIPRG